MMLLFFILVCNLKSNVVVSVIGVRRAGKSFILRQVARKISKVWGKENVAFVNLEDVRFTELSPELGKNDP